MAAAMPYALSCDVGPGGGQEVWVWDNVNKRWGNDGGAEGTSITHGEDGFTWLIAADDTVWGRISGHWSSLGTNRCEGGSIALRHAVGQNNIAVGKDSFGSEVYAVESVSGKDHLLWWNGSCWFRMPGLPSGSVREVGMYNSSLPWVRNHNQEIYRWNGSSWISLAPGIGTRLVRRYIRGSDKTSIWTFSTSSGWTRVFDDWTNGLIRHIGPRASNFTGISVIDSDRNIWVRNSQSQ